MPLGRSLFNALAAASVLSLTLAADHQTPVEQPLVPVAPELGRPSNLPQDGVPDILVGTASGGGEARLFSGTGSHGELARGVPFGTFAGSVRVAAGDVNGDGVADAAVAMGPGTATLTPGSAPVGGLVKIFNGLDASLIAEGHPFGPGAVGGIHVALGDVDGDGLADLIAGEGTGPHVRSFNLVGAGAVFGDATPYGTTFTGGVRVAAGDIDGDGAAEIITAPAAGPGSVRLYNGTLTTLKAELSAFGAGFTGGVFIASGDVNGDGLDDLIASTASGGGHIKVFNAANGNVLYDVFGFPAGITGISVAAADFNADGKADIVGGSVPGPFVGVLDGATGALLTAFSAPAVFGGGVLVAAPSKGPITFTSDDETTFTVGQSNTFTITTSATPTVTTIAQTGTLPTGVTFTDNHDGTATLSGNPSVGTGGTYSLTFTATNGLAAPEVQTFTLNVDGPPQIVSATATTFRVGAAGTFAVTTTGFPVPALVSSGALPAGVTFTDNGDGTATLGGTPASGTANVYPLTFTATNGVGASATQTFTLTVDSAPAFTSAAAVNFVVGVAGAFAITTAGDPAVSNITQTGTLPTGVAFIYNGNGTATLSGTPAGGTEGTYPLVLTASNGVGVDAVQNFTLTVQLAPSITSANTTTLAVGTAGTFNVTTTGAPAPGLSIVGTLPAGITFVDNGNGTGTLSGTAAAGTGGSHAFAIQASNGAGSPATQAFTLLIDEAPLVTSGDAATFVVGTLGTFTVTTSGSPAPTITRGGVPILPAGMTFTDNLDGTGTLTGTPLAGMGGTYPLTFLALNSAGASPLQSFTLTVNEATSFGSADSTTFVLNTLGTFAVTTVGFPDATLTASGLPAGVTFVDNGDGSANLSGTPTLSGSFPVTITANNGIGGPVTQSFTLSIHEAPAITSGASTSFLELNPGTFTVMTTGFPVPTITLGGAALPAGVAFVDNGDGTGTLAGTPAGGTSGTYSLTFQATNSAGLSPQGFTLSVNAAPQITSASSTTFTAGAVSSFPVTTTGVPAPTVSATGTLPTGITFNIITKTFEGTPNQIGTFTPIQITATNGVGTDATQLFTLEVICPVITVSSTPTTVPNGVFNTTYAGATFSRVGGGTGTWSATGLPPGLSVDANTGVLSGTPTNTGVFNGTVTFTGMANCQGSQNVSISVAPNPQPDSYAGGLGNTQIVVAGHSSPSTPFFSFASNILANDQGPSLTLTTVTNATTTMGGQITIAADGAFTYTPQAGDTGNDTYNYTVTSNGVSAQATITLGLGIDRVWYVNASAGAGDGRSHSPFNALTNLNGAGDVDDDGDYIYLYAGTYPSGITAEPSQTVWGAGSAFNPVSGLTIAAVAKPTLQGTVNIAGDNVTISSIGIATSGVTGMTNTGVHTGLTVKNNVTVVATNASAVVFSGVSSTNGGAPNFGINFLSVSASNATKGISLQNVNSSAGSFVITGTDGGDAGTIADPGTGGVIGNMTQRGVELSNVSRAVSLNGMTFTNAGSTDGAASTQCDAPNTGDNTLCNAAIYLVNAGSGGSVALNGIWVNGGSQLGIIANGVNNLTMNLVEVENVGTDTHESGAMLQNLTGNGSIANSHFHNNAARQLYMVNTSGTLSSFTITGSTFENSIGPNGVQGLLIEAFGAATTMNVSTGVSGNGNTFNNTFNMGWMAQANQNATVTASLIDATVTNTNGIAVQASSGGHLNTDILNSSFTAGANSVSGAIAIKTDGGGSMVGNVIGNTIGQNGVAGSGTICSGCNGMFINPRGAGSSDLTIIGNTIQNVNGPGIFINSGEAAAQAFDAVITGNLIRQPGPQATLEQWAMYIRNGVDPGPPVADGGCMALTLGGLTNPGTWPSQTANAMNQILGTWNANGGLAEIRLRRSYGTSLNLPGLSGTPAAWITARNSFDGTLSLTEDDGVPFGSLATCNP
jgi:putative cofactor-binding repeat protein